MDLANIIGELKLELQCIDAAIVSMEQLAHVQNIAIPDARKEAPTDPEPAQSEPPVKRGRGRPRKYPLPVVEQNPQPKAGETPESAEQSTVPET